MMKRIIYLFALAATSSLAAAEYSLDFSSAGALDAEAPVLRRSEMSVGVGAIPAVAVGDVINLRLFGDVDFALRIVSAPPPGIAGQSFIAKDENGSASAIVKVSAGKARISVEDFMNRRQYSVRCNDGKALIVERDNSMDDAGECGTCAGATGEDVEAAADADTTAVKGKRLLRSPSKALLRDSNAFEFATQKPIVDVLVAFDRGAKAWALSTKSGTPEWNWDTIEECAEAAVARMNLALANSQIDEFTFRLVGVTEIDAAYTNIDDPLLNALHGGVPPFNNISLLRDQYGADTVTLLVNVDENQNSYNTGIANGLYDISDSGIAKYISEKKGYNICHIQRTFREWTMAHETGHCLGCGHSNAHNNFVKPQSTTYSCGYHFVAATDGKRYRTIMGYNSAQGYGWDPAPYFSSPDITPVEYGVPIGTAVSNDNRRVLRESCAGVSTYREHALPYEWDVRFLDDDGNDIPGGSYFHGEHYVTLDHANANAIIYYTYDGSTPTQASAHCAPGTRIAVDAAATITAGAVIDGVMQSVRTITFNHGLAWSGDADGNGLWLNGDSSVCPWSGASFNNGDTVLFPNLADVASPTVTVKGVVSPGSVAFAAFETPYTFDKGDDEAKISIPGDNFAPDGDLTFNVPVQFEAATFTNMIGRALTFNAPFGQTVDAASGYCTNRIVVGSSGVLTVAPGEGKTQTFDRFNTSTYYSSATVRLGEGNIVFNGPYDSGYGLFGNVQLIVGSGANVYFNCAAATGYWMTSPFTVEKDATVTFDGSNGSMEIMQRPLYLAGGTLVCNNRFDKMYAYGISVTDDSEIKGSGYMLIRYANEPMTVADGKTLTINIPTQDGSNTTGWGIIKRGGGTLVANKELKHSGATVVSNGMFAVGYSSGSATYGTGWTVASNATLKVKSGCTLKVPALALDPTATISVPVAESAPLIVNGNVDLTGVGIEIHDVSDLSLGASYPIISATGEMTGLKSLVRSSLPKPATGLGWKLAVAEGTLTASIVNAADSDPYVDFITNIPGIRLSMPDDAVMTDHGGLIIDSSPIVITNISTRAFTVSLDVEIPSTMSNTDQTICSWSVEGNIIRCVITNGVLDCFYAANGHSDNVADFISVASGRHTIKIGYNSDGSYPGTCVYVDNALAYSASGLKWGGKDVTRIAVGATAADTSTYPYKNLIVRALAVANPNSTEALPKMTSSGGQVEYNYLAANSLPHVFPLTPSGGFETCGAVLSAGLASSYEELSVSIVASFPEDATGTIFSSVVRPNDSYASYATQVEYRGDGVLAFRDDGGSSLVNTCKVSANFDSPHLYTITYKMGDGFKLYMDGEEVLTNSGYFQGKSLLVWARVVFGCGYWTNWMTSYNDNPNPISNLKVYASHIALGTSDRTVSESAVNASVEPANPQEPEEPEDPDPDPPATPFVVDVLVAYDNGARTYVADKGATLEAFAATQIQKMNDVLATNRLDRFYSYRLAGVCRVDDTYSDINAAPALAAEGAGAMVSLRAARELCGADTVTLLVATSGATLGNSSPLSSTTDVASQHECAFSVCSISAVDSDAQHTMIHENAHNMGCGHARAQSDPASPFPYGRGFYFKDGNVTRHTIMAYGGDNDASWYFSTTSDEFGFVLGDKTNNNARVLKETCSEVAKWREGAAITLAGVEIQDIAFTTSVRYPWAVEGDTIRSYNQTDYTYQCTTPLKATIAGPKRLSFKHKSYFGGKSFSDNKYSHFDVLLDDSPVLTQTECTNSWTAASVTIPEGTHEVTFVFSQRFAMNNQLDYKDYQANPPADDDAVWLKEITLEDAVVTTELNIPAGTSVNLADVGASIETITGEGTLVCDAALPTKDYGLTDVAWKGTVAFSGLSGATYNDFQFELYGNAGSWIQLTNCAIPYLKNNNATFAGTLVLASDAGGNAAFSTSNGYSANYNAFGALEGDGSMAFTGPQQQAYVFNVATNFTGSITIGAAADGGAGGAIRGRRVVFGSVASDGSDLPSRESQSASITVKPGAAASIGGDATWNAYHGVEIAGTLIVKGDNATLDCNSGGTMGLVLDDGATLRLDAAGAKLTFARPPVFASGLVDVAFGEGVPSQAGRFLAWPDGSTLGGKFRLVGDATNNYEIVTDATGASVAAKPNDRLDLSGYSYIEESDVSSWLVDTDYYDWEYEMYDSWQDYMIHKTGIYNGYTYLQNFLLGYTPDGYNQKFQAKISFNEDGDVVIETTEGTMPAGFGVVKRLLWRPTLDDPWVVEEMTGKKKTFDGGASGFYKVEVVVEGP